MLLTPAGPITRSILTPPLYHPPDSRLSAGKEGPHIADEVAVDFRRQF
jgi:hypothetical protein